jgi:two-component system chemotaxis response regulator CheY
VTRTFEAGNGREALALARSEKVNLILTDLNMPEMGGEALAREILADPATAHIPVVVVSADPNPGRARDLADLGVRGFIRKPFTPEALRDTLGRLLQQEEAQ